MSRRGNGNQVTTVFYMKGSEFHLINERCTFTDDGRLEFDLLTGEFGGPETRVGGFVARRD